MKLLPKLIARMLFPLLLLVCGSGVAQDLSILNNLYEKADEYTKHRNAFNRERWFYEQRMYPVDRLPEDAYKNALQQRDHMRAQRGFFSSRSQVTWTNIGPTSGYYFAYGNISSRITTIKYDPNFLVHSTKFETKSPTCTSRPGFFIFLSIFSTSTATSFSDS